ncbi:MAG: hypothetical protein E2O96_08150 [Acidobacteria bacterium]|nr:MAG: hypothetical protein E2O96_08150 [Acidobacteriota bacterium]
MQKPEPSELARAFVSEILLAVAATRTLGETAGLRVESVRVEASATPAIEGPPEEQSKWDLEMRFRAGDAPTQVRAEGSIGNGEEIIELPTGAAVFAELPTSALKGIDEVRREILERSGINTIGELARIDDNRLGAITQKERFPSAIEFRTKALLTHGALPLIPASRADKASLLELAHVSAAKLQKMIGGKAFDALSAAVLHDFLKLLMIAIDSRVLAGLELGHLRRGAR